MNRCTTVRVCGAWREKTMQKRNQNLGYHSEWWKWMFQITRLAFCNLAWQPQSCSIRRWGDCCFFVIAHSCESGGEEKRRECHSERKRLKLHRLPKCRIERTVLFVWAFTVARTQQFNNSDVSMSDCCLFLISTDHCMDSQTLIYCMLPADTLLFVCNASSCEPHTVQTNVCSVWWGERSSHEASGDSLQWLLHLSLC